MFIVDLRHILTENEIAVMCCLWDKPPLTVNEIYAGCSGARPSKRSLHNILTRLTIKGLISITGERQEGRNYLRLYAPAIGHDEYMASKIEADPAYLPERLPYIVGRLIPNLKTETFEKLRAIVEAERETRT